MDIENNELIDPQEGANEVSEEESPAVMLSEGITEKPAEDPKVDKSEKKQKKEPKEKREKKAPKEPKVKSQKEVKEKAKPQRDKKKGLAFLERICGPESERSRNIVHMIFGWLPIIALVVQLFCPFAIGYSKGEKIVLSPIGFFSNSESAGSFSYVELAMLLIILVTLVIVAAKGIRNIFLISNEEKIYKGAKSSVIFASVMLGVYTVISVLFSPINVMMGGFSEADGIGCTYS